MVSLGGNTNIRSSSRRGIKVSKRRPKKQKTGPPATTACWAIRELQAIDRLYNETGISHETVEKMRANVVKKLEENLKDK